MSDIFKHLIAIIVSVAVLAFIYLGSIAPVVKSKRYIDLLNDLEAGRINNVLTLLDKIDNVSAYYSPIGNNEIISSYIGVILRLVFQNKNQQIYNALVTDASGRAQIFNTKKGFNISQGLLQMATLYTIGATTYMNEKYYQKAVDANNFGLTYSRGRKPFYDNLLNLYVAFGNKEKAKQIGETILKYWPEDDKIKQVFKSL